MRELFALSICIFWLFTLWRDLQRNRIRLLSYITLNGFLILISISLIKPSILTGVSAYFGFVVTANLIFIVILGLLGLSTYSLIKRVHRMEKQISLLTSLVVSNENKK
jgi:hypothetical protein